MSTVLDLASLKLGTCYVTVHSSDRYTTNIDLEALRAPGVLFARRIGGKPLEPNHGYPVDLVVRARDGWKSTK